MQGNYDKFGSNGDANMEEFINAFDFRDSSPENLRSAMPTERVIN